MNPHRHGLGEIRSANDDRYMVAQTFAAAKHDEFGIRRALERHWRASNDAQFAQLGAAIAEDGGRIDADDAGFDRSDFAQRNDDDGWQNVGQGRKLDSDLIELDRRRNGSVDLRIGMQRQPLDARQVDHRQCDGARASSLHAQAP